ncbi:MAG: thymidine kinase [Actinomycetaceae bacterium]
MGRLVFFSGTMDSGKSTLALQVDHNHAARGLGGLRFSRSDRGGEGVLSSRLGLRADALEVTDTTDFWAEVVRRRTAGERVDYLVCDEAQFYTAEQVEQLARLADLMDLSVFAFGITTDFRTRLFPGAARLVELADRVERLQVEALCWCGDRATHNARTVDGAMVTEGEQVVVGDTAEPGTAARGSAVGPEGRADEPVVAYEVLCRNHHMRGMTVARARAAELSPQTLDLSGT